MASTLYDQANDPPIDKLRELLTDELTEYRKAKDAAIRRLALAVVDLIDVAHAEYESRQP